jgi:hypothetical protein
MLQQSLFENEELPKSHCYQGGSHVSLTALQASVWHLVTSVIYGENLQGSYVKLSQDGSWQKTYQGYLQVSLDGSLDEFLGTWTRWGIVSDGEVFEPHGLEPYIDESEYSLLPTPMSNEYKGTSRKRFNGSDVAHYNRVAERIRIGLNCPTYLNPNYGEVLMGFPVGWTDLNA